MFKLITNIFYLAFSLAVVYIVYAIIVGDINFTTQFMAIGKAVGNMFA